jgi:deaminated glutathione amidase
MSIRIALVQTNSSQYIDSNLYRIADLIREAARENVSAIFLPENFGALGNGNPRQIGEGEMTPSGILRSFVAHMATEVRCWLFAGTIPTCVRPDGSGVPDRRVRAASFVMDDLGREVARYDKVHMFDVDVADSQGRYQESAVFEAGGDVVVVDSPIGKIGLSVCYDIRFPELYRSLARLEARSFSIPSAFTRVTGAAHFEILMRARAIENQAFTIAACQAGKHDSGRETYGHSMVVDPWGDVLCQGDDDDGVLVAELDFARQDRVRADMPVLRQRRVGL